MDLDISANRSNHVRHAYFCHDTYIRNCGAEVCMWLGPSHRQAKDNEKNSGVDGSLTRCGDAQKESENKAFIQVFHPIQSVKSTNKVILRYTHTKSSPVLQRWRS